MQQADSVQGLCRTGGGGRLSEERNLLKIGAVGFWRDLACVSLHDVNGVVLSALCPATSLCWCLRHRPPCESP